MDEHPEEFDKTLQIALGNESHSCWRAAWIIKHCMVKNDPRVRKYLDEIIHVLPYKEDGHQRELLKVLMGMKLSEEQEIYLFDHCVTLWESTRKIPSIRVAALTMMVNIARRYPELSGEVLAVSQSQYLQSLSPGIRRSAKGMIRSLEY